MSKHKKSVKKSGILFVLARYRITIKYNHLGCTLYQTHSKSIISVGPLNSEQR